MKTQAIRLLATAALFLAAVAPAAAQELKIGYVNSERVLREAPLSMAAQKRLEKEFSGRDAELQKMAKQARELQTQFDKDGVTMSDSERKAKERELANQQREL